jgi:hypothetical protein
VWCNLMIAAYKAVSGAEATPSISVRERCRVTWQDAVRAQ